MPWGQIVFAAVALAFVVLIIIAVVRMRRKNLGGGDETELEAGAEGQEPVEADEEGEGAGADAGAKPATSEDRGKPVGKVSFKPPRELATTVPDSPHALDRAIKDAPAKRPPKDRGAEKQRLSAGLAKTRGGFIAKLGALFKGKTAIDPALVEQIEEILFTADIGTGTSSDLIEGLRKELSKQELQNPEAVWAHIKRRSAEILENAVAPPLDLDRAKPFVILVVGVNGTGKTTTIGKLAARIREEERSVVLAAGDTFRAAAAEQLQIWGDRAQAQVVKGKEGADPSSVIIDALKVAQESKADVVIADTAGRLHTKVNLMEEIQKVRRSIGKRIEGAPHETFLVLDSTTGQNAIAQAKMFKEAVDITGIVLTKLDGTAKGGVVLGICNELRVPVRYIGIGERAEDLREFDAEAFVEALYEGAGSE